ncbi:MULTISPECIES: hypothetical protein [Kosmotoga]|uniref:Uncharacterized protein n=1 Tax=Kosmotoga olearia (strain ATCC BAA-1733 / DSM 21960 / TBF 19.5.1) TaxID=521045 RepID=C5CG49_KOSOT|nr:MULTISPECIES: hypothetical protein [Kosmotoga]ACR79490.1 hypothetical protein Kole_0778 [Kosmotoga olearia TBF 19.5.1]ACR79507.1 hypothetical protein Kole_0796 [Kosmotoga olearia TBF 19.5.1]OAA18478.1 hypothetical protein DU53_12210 [Kosmotoga sp. DU53]
MRILFKHRHWIVIQAIYLIIGILSALIFKSNGKMFGGMAIGLHFISNTQELLIPILSLMLADLAFNVEYVEGTFLRICCVGKVEQSGCGKDC